MKTYLRALSDFTSDVKQARDDINEAQPVADMIGLPVNEILKETKPMALTNASLLSDTIKTRLSAAKERIAGATEKVGGAMDKLERVAGEADKVVTQIEREATELEQSLGQFTNFAPD